MFIAVITPKSIPFPGTAHTIRYAACILVSSFFGNIVEKCVSLPSASVIGMNVINTLNQKCSSLFSALLQIAVP